MVWRHPLEEYRILLRSWQQQRKRQYVQKLRFTVRPRFLISLGSIGAEGMLKESKKCLVMQKKASMELIHIPSSIKKPDLALAGNISHSKFG